MGIIGNRLVSDFSLEVSIVNFGGQDFAAARVTSGSPVQL